MRIPIACFSCGKQGSVRESYAGREVKCKACGGTVMVPCTASDTAISSLPAPPSQPQENVGHHGVGTALNRFWESARVTAPKGSQATNLPRKKLPSHPNPEAAKSPSDRKSASSANVESTHANPKQAPPPAPTDQEEGWHPALWGLIGGIGVAVAALIIAFVIPRGEKAPVRDAKQAEEPGHQLAAKDDARPGTEQAPKAQLSAEQLFAQTSPGVVTLTCNNDLGEIITSGSGFFVNDELVHEYYKVYNKVLADLTAEKNGRPFQVASLLTNYHVIEAAIDADIVLSDGSRGDVYMVHAEDETLDLALLSVLIDSTKSPKRLQLAERAPPVGATVYAIGSPRGFANSLSAGVISGGSREISPGVHWLQTTAPISPGSSGGPLLTPAGEVVGVNTAYRKDGQNLNFAVPVSEMRRFLSATYHQRRLWEGRSIRKQESDSFSRASNWLEKQRKSKPLSDNDPVELLLKARILVGKGKYEETIQTLPDAASSIPTEFRYLYHFLVAKTRFLMAIRWWEKNSGRTVQEGERNFQSNEHAEASLQSIKRAAGLNSGFAPTFSLLADYHRFAGEWHEARVAANTLVKLAPRCAESYYTRGKIQLKLDLPKSALEDLQLSAKLNPFYAPVHMEIGDCLAELEEYEKSIDSYKTALSMNPFSPSECHYRIGRAYQKAGKYQQAIVAYQKARRLPNPDPSFEDLCDQCISFCRERMR